MVGVAVHRASLVGWITGLSMLAGVGGAGAQADPVVLADGHVDYAARMVSGQLRSQIKDGTQGADRVVWRDPADVVFKVNRTARVTVPGDRRLAFLGPPGGSSWMIPQIQKPGILWAGWNTEELTAAEIGGSIAWTLQAAQGPGTVAVFQTGSFGQPDVIFNSADGLPDTRLISIGVHAHANWAFSEPGSYRLSFQMTAARPSGESGSDTQTLSVLVEGDPAGSPSPSSPPPSSPSNPSTPAPVPTPARGGSKLTLLAGKAQIAGRTLSFEARLNRTSRLDVTVRRAGQVVTRAKARTISGSSRRRTLRVRLGRTLKPGARYQAVIRVRADGKTVTRTLTLNGPRAHRAGTVPRAR